MHLESGSEPPRTWRAVYAIRIGVGSGFAAASFVTIGRMKIVEPTPEHLDLAATTLQAGGLVVVPTETVYGLACRAMDPEAVRRVFEAKGRPPENPLIVHVATLVQVRELADVSDLAEELMERFWPGPLTIVLPVRSPRTLPLEVTAGLGTVAVRMPSNPILLALIVRVGPLAAPSANRFTQLSPTRATDVDPDLGDFLVLDGGPCGVGIESTVLDLSGPTRILRSGMISAHDLEAAGVVLEAAADDSTKGRSPGQHPRHYAPRTPVRLVERLGPEDVGLTFGVPAGVHQVPMPRDPASYAVKLYAALADLDRLGAIELRIEWPPDEPDWAAIRDRLRRASTE